MKVACEVGEVELDGDYATVRSICVTCSRCGHEAQAYGTSQRSVRRALVTLREECPQGENNFYVDEDDGEGDEEDVEGDDAEDNASTHADPGMAEGIDPTMPLLGRLMALGGNGGEVAASLRRKGIKGERFRCTSCPLARFALSSAPPDVARSIVGHVFASCYAEDSRQLEQTELPTGCHDFVERFDMGEYPDLVEAAEDA